MFEGCGRDRIPRIHRLLELLKEQILVPTKAREQVAVCPSAMENSHTMRATPVSSSNMTLETVRSLRVPALRAGLGGRLEQYAGGRAHPAWSCRPGSPARRSRAAGAMSCGEALLHASRRSRRPDAAGKCHRYAMPRLVNAHASENRVRSIHWPDAMSFGEFAFARSTRKVLSGSTLF